MILETIKNYILYLKWKYNGKPTIKHNGYHCGLCGKWIDKPFETPEYVGRHPLYGWGVCPNEKCEEFRGWKNEIRRKN